MLQPPADYQFGFDQYQRYRDIQTIAAHLSEHEFGRPLRILDVGGTEHSQQFLHQHQVFTANLDDTAGSILNCSGMELPFADSAFDLVVTADTLEHIPADQRKVFVSELARVTDAYLVITGPFGNGMNEEAERLLDEFLREVLGLRHRFLTEHLTYGLPELEQTCGWLQAHALATVTIPSGYVTRWLPLMLIRFYLTQLHDGNALSSTLEAMYNSRFYWQDHREPSYRQIIVGMRRADATTLHHLRSRFVDAAAGQLDLESLIALWQATVGIQALETRDRRIRELEAEARQLPELRAQVRQLESLVTAYRSGRFMRTMAWLQRTKQHFKLC